MRNLKLFDTTASYEAAESGLILPNVSLITENGNVMYKGGSPAPSHDYVEIAGIKWATMNIGAESITDYGLYFQWGDTQGYTAAQVGSGSGKKYFGWADYKYGDGTSSPSNTGITKYNSTDGLTVLEASDDAVTAAWGNGWRLPTKDEFVALGAAVNTTMTNNYQGSGVSGLVCTDKTDSSKVLFFPTGGDCSNGSVGSVGRIGNYLSSSLHATDGIQYFYGFFISSYSKGWDSKFVRYYGLLARGVMNE